MINLEELKAKNPNLKIYEVDDRQFECYGRRVTGLDVKELLDTARQIAMPEKGSVYEASVPSFETLSVSDTMRDLCFGELPIQVGYCYGHSNQLNAWEWHTCSEINAAVTDMVLILAERKQMRNGTIDSSEAKAFLVREGDVIEVYATSLHFCPCEVHEGGFGCVVVLPKGTNTTLERPASDPYLFRKNKWLAAHQENQGVIARGAAAGITGVNYKILY